MAFVSVDSIVSNSSNASVLLMYFVSFSYVRLIQVCMDVSSVCLLSYVFFVYCLST
jgi:hypothetical protein